MSPAACLVEREMPFLLLQLQATIIKCNYRTLVSSAAISVTDRRCGRYTNTNDDDNNSLGIYF
jgi:hypothetical protein